MATRPLAPLLAVGLLALAPVAAGQLPDASDHVCADAETLEVGDMVICLAWHVGEVQNASGSPAVLLTGSCWPQSWRTVYGSPEDKWTPLYAVNSPSAGKGQVILENNQALDMNIGFTWKGTGTTLKKSQTVGSGVALTAYNGDSIGRYQSLEWKPYKKQYCGWDVAWHTWEEGYRATDYTPDGFVDRDFGHLEGADTTTDADNSLIPSEPWFNTDNTIGIDMRFVTYDLHDCFPPESKHWFGENSVYQISAQMTFGGVFEAGATKSRAEASTFVYEFDSGCYWVDPLGPNVERAGWAFLTSADRHAAEGGGECAGKDILASGATSCAEEACSDGVPSVAVVQDALCGAVPSCEELGEIPLVCSSQPGPCGGGDGFGEPCVPSKPSCPPPAVALGVDSCDPCDALKTPMVACGVPHPTCEDAGLDCPPVPRPCSDYAPGLSGDVARWVCERDAPDPCEGPGLNQAEAVFHCGDDEGED